MCDVSMSQCKLLPVIALETTLNLVTSRSNRWLLPVRPWTCSLWWLIWARLGRALLDSLVCSQSLVGQRRGLPHLASSWLAATGVQESLATSLTLQQATGLVHLVAAESTREREDFEASWRPGLGLAQLGFCHTVGQSKSLARPDPRGGEIDSTFQWEELQSLCKEACGQGGDAGGHVCKHRAHGQMLFIFV